MESVLWNMRGTCHAAGVERISFHGWGNREHRVVCAAEQFDFAPAADIPELDGAIALEKALKCGAFGLGMRIAGDSRDRGRWKRRDVDWDAGSRCYFGAA